MPSYRKSKKMKNLLSGQDLLIGEQKTKTLANVDVCNTALQGKYDL